MLRILHVDDHKDHLELTKRHLLSLADDLHFEWAESAAQALELLEKSTFHCVLCDYQMPGMDGLRLLKAIRERGDDTPFIFLTGQGSEEIAGEALRSGADDYYTKDVGLAHYDRLVNSIRRVVAARQQQAKQQKAEQALRESEERYRAFISQSTEGIWRLETDPPIPLSLPEDEMIEQFYKGTFIAECNEALAKMYGYSSVEDLVGARMLDLHGGPENYEKNIEGQRSFIRGGFRITDVETEEIDKGGNIKYFLNNAIGIIKDGYLLGGWGTQRDITGIKQAETELKRSKQLFEQLFVQNPLAAVYADADFRIIDVNPQFMEVFGFSKEEVFGKTINEIIVPKEKTTEASRFDEKTREVYISEETSRKRKNGSIVHVSIYAGPIRVDGQTIGYIGLYNDITQRVRATQALLESERNYKSLTENIAVGIYRNTPGPSGRFLEANPALLKMFGVENKEEFLETSVADLYAHPDDRRKFNETMLRDGHARNEELLLKRKDGGTFIASVSAVAVKDEKGQVEFYDGIIEDITERKKTEEALRESEARFRSIFENSTIGIYRTTPSGQILMANPALVRMLGYACFEDLAKRNLEQEGLESQYPRSMFKQMVEKEGRIYRLESAWKRRDGTTIFVSESATVIRDAAGDVAYYEGCVEDITDRRKAEIELKISRDRLEAKTRELQTINRELESFSYSVSHDLRSPLHTIAGLSNLLLSDYSEKLDKRISDYLQRILAAAQRMDRLIQDLLELSRVARSDIHYQHVDMSNLVRQIISDMEKTRGDRDVDVLIAENVEVEGDDKLLRLVLENLMENAWKFTRIREKAVIEFGVAATDSGSAFFVRDNGIGFDKEKADMLFVPFKRLHEDEEFEGTGLGLATVQRIVHRHGGRIWAESEPGNGATFFFTLPRAGPLLKKEP
jgi:PAS domain S-box-containing protein